MTYGNGPQGQQQWGPQGPQGYPQQQPKKKSKLKWVLIIVGILLVVGMCSVATSGDDSGESTNARSTDSSSVQGSNPEPEQQEDDVPREYKNAKKRAESYLKSGHFSYDGLYNQLTSEYGEGFPPDAAQYAMDNIEVDWNQEAVEAAESYLSWSAMSRADLLQQLTSEYGEGFTPEQAEFAVNQVY